jgi:hypothetical protein
MELHFHFSNTSSWHGDKLSNWYDFMTWHRGNFTFTLPLLNRHRNYFKIIILIKSLFYVMYQLLFWNAFLRPIRRVVEIILDKYEPKTNSPNNFWCRSTLIEIYFFVYEAWGRTDRQTRLPPYEFILCKKKIHMTVWLGNLMGRDDLEDVDVNGRILKISWDAKK